MAGVEDVDGEADDVKVDEEVYDEEGPGLLAVEEEDVDDVRIALRGGSDGEENH